MSRINVILSSLRWPIVTFWASASTPCVIYWCLPTMSNNQSGSPRIVLVLHISHAMPGCKGTLTSPWSLKPMAVCQRCCVQYGSPETDDQTLTFSERRGTLRGTSWGHYLNYLPHGISDLSEIRAGNVIQKESMRKWETWNCFLRKMVCMLQPPSRTD